MDQTHRFCIIKTTGLSFLWIISVSNRGTSGNAWYCHWGSYIVDTIWSFPLTNMTNMTFCSLTITITPSTDQPVDKIMPLLHNLTFYRILWEVSLEHLLWLWHVSREKITHPTPGPGPFRTCIIYVLLETNSFPKLAGIFLSWHFEHPSVLSLSFDTNLGSTPYCTPTIWCTETIIGLILIMDPPLADPYECEMYIWCHSRGFDM